MVAVRLTDAQIQRLISEPKTPSGLLCFRNKGHHREAQVDATGVTGTRFRVIVRENWVNPLDFSAILACNLPGSNRPFHLRRYNGRRHEHTNELEGTKSYDFHIHLATERYQLAGLDAEKYAEPTDAYADLAGAIAKLSRDCAFRVGLGLLPSRLL